ncbi:MAG: hypothetical protein RH917_06780 [Lacipirellulaceae bacterium]
MFPCRLIIDPPQSGVRNMVVDECLLEEAADEGVATLRFYQWSEPILSLGYFQKYEDRQSHTGSQSLPVVRRLSGGGTLLHDQELTYSLCLPSDHAAVQEPSRIYRVVHQAAIDALAQQDITLKFWDDFAKKLPTEDEPDEPFLCFQRRTDDDLVVPTETAPGSIKILGSAQRRRRGAVLQHGALLLSASPYAEELSGIQEASGVHVDISKACENWANRIAESLDLLLNPAEPLRESQESTQTKIEKRLTSDEWVRKR